MGIYAICGNSYVLDVMYCSMYSIMHSIISKIDITKETLIGKW
jgi:hypothetical protein